MYYEINVSKHGRHLFATAKRSLTTEKETREMLKLFRRKFPKSQGYELRANCYITRGTHLAV